MNYFYGDIFDFMETTLPSEFGGGPGDYQLVEEEDANAQTRLTLLIHPDIGDLDEARVMARIHEMLGKGSRANRFMIGLWKNVGTFRIDVQGRTPVPGAKFYRFRSVLAVNSSFVRWVLAGASTGFMPCRPHY